jgi:hypothetical protein
MKKLVSLSIFLTLIIAVRAQQWDWARKADFTTGVQGPNKVCADIFGNVFMLGINGDSSVYGATVLDSGSFVVKYDTGGVFLWAKKIPGIAEDIATDGSGNLFIIGSFSNTISIGLFSLINNGGEDIFLAKFNPAGAILWARSYGSVKNDEGTVIAVDKWNNVYIGGSFQDTIRFGNTQMQCVSTTPAGQLFFLVRMNSSGVVQWARTCPHNYSGGQYQYREAIHLRIDVQGNTYLMGERFLIPCSNYCFAYFLVKYDPSGNIMFDKRLWDSFEYPFGLAVDCNQNVFVIYNSGSHYTNNRTLRKYSPGMIPGWQLDLGSYGYFTNYTLVYGLSIDSLNNIYVAGFFGGASSSDSVQLCNQTIVGKGETDILVGKFDNNSNCIWVKTAGGVGYENFLVNYQPWPTMYVDSKGNCYLMGNYEGVPNDSVVFDNDTLTNDGNWAQVYLAKIGTTNPIVIASNEDESKIGNELLVFPNPTSGIFTLDLGLHFPDATVCVYDVLGNCVFLAKDQNDQLEIDLRNKAKGIYLVSVLSENNTVTRKIRIK